MNETPNPYQAPTSIQPEASWWEKLRQRFFTGRLPHVPNFLGGDAILFEGIAYFIDPNEPAVIYAASPSTDQSDQRMQLICAEAICLLPAFVGDYPELQSTIHGRKLTVRMIDRYADKQSEYQRQMEMNTAVVEAAFLSQRQFNPSIP
ncbi:hypothetical protein NHH03_25765 [Stieleria sp. TO1_6]|uniref:hypothetical protein n=1 Tax=Stieleria tagensis TaxID=2956795 RepID=UPI00209BA73B|nr:hypothetical protein [Stieleria tagensis]MCO8125170.1 hypothetical protein [Stieleria tagensis]